ncbi:MAG: matrixin family metalloprotease [Halobacteriales archaeon]|nr:matrixin family metalloprotease [Halobacteriales archaeon]
MKRVVTVLVCVAVAIAFTAAATAAPGNSGNAEKSQAGGKPVSIPDHAEEVAPGVYYLGTAEDHGRTVEGYMYVRYDEGYSHKDKHNPGGGNGGGGGGGGGCYAFIGDRHVEWQVEEPWKVNPNNDEGLGDEFILTNLTGSIGKWEAAAGEGMLGTGSLTTSTLSAETSGSPDGLNEVYFGSIDSEGAIAVTIVWGVFRGPPSSREIVEWDQVYDQVDYDWSDTGTVGKMDFENINTHELGHAVGMDHPDDSCTEETMYAYAEPGETKKQSLESGDKAGVNELYS